MAEATVLALAISHWPDCTPTTLLALLQLLAEEVADQFGALAVVRADEGHQEALLLQRGVVQFVVDVDHQNAGVDGLLQHRHQGLRVGRRDHQRVDLGDDHLLDQLDLGGGVLLVLDAVGDQVVLGGVGLLVLLGAVLHGQEELVGERLHHQRHLRLGVGGVGGGCERQQGHQGGGCEQFQLGATSHLCLHILILSIFSTPFGARKRLRARNHSAIFHAWHIGNKKIGARLEPRQLGV
jgi:hypothetical protein